MIETLWIWSAKNQWWTTGKVTVTTEVVELYSWEMLCEIMYYSFNTILHSKFEVPSHREVAKRLAGPYQFKTPAEIVEILNG